jgi:hypothetical protein
MKADVRTLIYSSPNGGAWFLCQEHMSGRAFIKHRADTSSGGHETDIGIAEFLSNGPCNPEHEALLRVMADGVAATPQPVRYNGTKIRTAPAR